MNFVFHIGKGIQNLLKNSSALIVDKDKLQLKLEVNPDFSQCTRYLKSIEVNLSRNSILHTFSDPFSSKNNLTISKIPFDLRCFKDIEVSVRPVWDNASTGLRDQKVYWNNSALKLILNKSTGYNFTHQGITPCFSNSNSIHCLNSIFCLMIDRVYRYQES